MSQEGRQNWFAGFLTKQFAGPPIIVDIQNDCESDPRDNVPTLLEFNAAVNSMNNGRATGIDGIPLRKNNFTRLFAVWGKQK